MAARSFDLFPSFSTFHTRIRMKLHTLAAGAAFIALAIVVPAQAHEDGHAHAPLHGGVVTEIRDMDYELVAKPALVQLYLRDHGKPASVSTASAKLTLLNGSEKQEVELKPVGEKLEASGSFKVGAGTKAVVVVTMAGKASTARFSLK